MTPLQYIIAGLVITAISGVVTAVWRHASSVSVLISSQGRTTTALLVAMDTKNADLFAESDKKTTRIEAILVGPDGDNGVRGNVERIIADVRTLKTERATQDQINAVWKVGMEMRVATLEKHTP